jgi:hypothetical protein
VSRFLHHNLSVASLLNRYFSNCNNDVSEIDLKTSISQVECCLKAIKSLRPGAWFLENPRAKLRELCAPLLEKYFPRHILYTVSCMFC